MNKKLLLVDRNKYWREKAANLLRNVGAEVVVSDEYKYSDKKFFRENIAPDLVILGCSNIRNDETRFINELLQKKLHVIVLSSILSPDELRHLFLSGVDDVATKPFDSDNLLAIVNETFLCQQPRDCFDEKSRSKA